MAELFVAVASLAVAVVASPIPKNIKSWGKGSYYKHAVRVRSKAVRRVVRNLVSTKQDLKNGYTLMDADTEVYDSRIILDALRKRWNPELTVTEAVARRFHDVKTTKIRSGPAHYEFGTFEAVVREAAQIEIRELSKSRLMLAGLFLDNCRDRKKSLVDVLNSVRDSLRLTAADNYGDDLYAGQDNFAKNTFVARLCQCRTLNEAVIEAMLQNLNDMVTNDFICKQGEVIRLAWKLATYRMLYVGCNEGNLVIFHGNLEGDPDGVLEEAKEKLLSTLGTVKITDVLDHFLPACVLRDVVIGRHCDTQFLSCVYARRDNVGQSDPVARGQPDLLDLVKAASMNERRIQSKILQLDVDAMDNIGIITNEEDFRRVNGPLQDDKPVYGIPEIDSLLDDIGRNTECWRPYTGLSEIYTDADDYYRLSSISTSAFQRLTAEYKRMGNCDYDGDIRIDDDVLTSLTGNSADDSYLRKSWHKKHSYVVRIQDGYLIVEPCRRIVYVVRNDNPNDLNLMCTTSQRVESLRSEKALCAVACLATSVTPGLEGGLRLISLREIRDKYRRGFYNAGYDLNKKVTAMMCSEIDLWENCTINASAVFKCSEMVCGGLSTEDKAWVVREAIAQLSRRATIVDCIDRAEGCFRECVAEADNEMGHKFVYDKRVPASGLMMDTFLEQGREVRKLRSRGEQELVITGPGPILRLQSRPRIARQARSVVSSDVMSSLSECLLA